jgi:hypothetical protein
MTPLDDRNTPATKGDVADSEQRMIGALADSEQRVVEKLVEAMRDVETKLLQPSTVTRRPMTDAFWKWRQTNRFFAVGSLCSNRASWTSNGASILRRHNSQPVRSAAHFQRGQGQHPASERLSAPGSYCTDRKGAGKKHGPGWLNLQPSPGATLRSRKKA